MAAFQDYGAEATGFQSSQSTEKSIKSCYAVVYELDNRKWVVAGEGGWSEVHLCEDSLDNSHRILAWTVKSQQVLMNCNVTAECAYKEKSKNFHSFSDENGNRYGLGFHKSESGLKQATQFRYYSYHSYYAHYSLSISDFLKSVKQVIEQCKSDLNPSPPEAPLHEYEKPQNQSKSKTPQHPTPQYPSSSNPTDNYEQNNKSQSNAYGNNNGYGNDDAYNGNQLQSSQPGGGINNNNGSGMPPPNPYQNSNSISNQYGQQQNDYDNGYGQNQNQNSYNQQKNNYQQPQPPPMFSQAPDNNNGNGNGYNQGYGAQQNRNNDYQQQNKYGQQNVNDYGSNNNNQYGSSQQQQPVQPSYNNNNQQNTYNNPVSPNNKDPTSPSTAALKNGVASGGNNNFPQYHLAKEQHKSIPTVPLGPLGNLKILPPKQQKHLSGDKKIKQPTAVEHKIRVLHDKETGLYSGLPKEWQEQLNKQFGVNPKQLPGISFNQYQSKIPKVLHMLRSALEEANGYQQVGIFRLAPNASDNKAVKEKIDKGQLENSEEKVDVNVYANLIKVWFRDLPDPLLNCVNPDKIEHVATQSDAANVVNSFPEPNKSIFLWLCDMCVDIARFEKTNKMSAQNMAIVVGPNLFNTDKFENPMKAMTYSGKVVEFFKHAILWRQSSM